MTHVNIIYIYNVGQSEPKLSEFSDIIEVSILKLKLRMDLVCTNMSKPYNQCMESESSVDIQVIHDSLSRNQWIQLGNVMPGSEH